MALLAKVLTVSDGVAAGDRLDASGPALRQRLEAATFTVLEHRVVSDGLDVVAEALRELSRDFTGLLVTTGGTGFSPRDLTPEATRRVIEREAPGFAEAMRRSSPLGALSRAVVGTIGSCLIVNLPGSERGARESLETVLGLVPHALELLAGERPH